MRIKFVSDDIFEDENSLYCWSCISGIFLDCARTLKTLYSSAVGVSLNPPKILFKRGERTDVTCPLPKVPKIGVSEALLAGAWICGNGWGRPDLKQCQ